MATTDSRSLRVLEGLGCARPLRHPPMPPYVKSERGEPRFQLKKKKDPGVCLGPDSCLLMSSCVCKQFLWVRQFQPFLSPGNQRPVHQVQSGGHKAPAEHEGLGFRKNAADSRRVLRQEERNTAEGHQGGLPQWHVKVFL